MKYQSIFTDATDKQRKENFEDYWVFTQQHGGELFEEAKDLAKKRQRLQFFQDHPVTLKVPLKNPESFYRNYIEMQDDPNSLDKMTLMLTAIYKFARHEWVGIKGAWEYSPSMAEAPTLEARISRMHLAEEFCHVRLFDEMLKTCGLEKVEWVPLSPWKEKVYAFFPKLPAFLLNAPAFVTELMGVTFYFHLHALIEDVLKEEPEVCARLKALLDEITIDEIAHVGQRRNFIGSKGIQFSKKLVKPFYTHFFNDIPEVALLFNIEEMIEDGLAFDFNQVPTTIIERSWVPSYCQL
jgi:hypothetical protein